MQKQQRADRGLFGVTSPKEADAGAVGRIPVATDVANATNVAKAVSAALADMGSARLADIVTDEEGDRTSDDLAS